MTFFWGLTYLVLLNLFSWQAGGELVSNEEVDIARQLMEEQLHSGDVALTRLPDLNKMAGIHRDAFKAISSYVQELNNLKDKIPKPEEKADVADKSKQTQKTEAVQHSGIWKKWVNAGDLSSFLKLEEQSTAEASPQLEVPVQVDLVFLGFEGDGGNLLKVHREELEKWFQHMEGALPHITLESVNPRSFLEDRGSNRDDAVLPYRVHLNDLQNILKTNPLPWDPPQSQGRVHREITYRYRFHVVEVSDKVLPALETVMQTHLRFDDVQSKGGQIGYIPAWYMEDALQALTDKLTSARWEVLETPVFDSWLVPELIADGPPAAFTLYIINPKLLFLSKFKQQSYGYRWGFSWADIASVADEPDLVDKARHVAKTMALETMKKVKGKDEKPVQQIAASQAPFLQSGFGRSAPKVAPRTGLIRWRDSKEATRGWADHIQGEYASKGKSQPLADEITKLLDSDKLNPAQVSVMHQVLTHHAGPLDLEGVLSEMWLAGNGRFGWIDLGAGPFSWGPMVGGTGAKTKHSPQRPPPPTSLKNARKGPVTEPLDDQMTPEEAKARLAVLHEYVDRTKVRVESLEEQMGCDLKSSGGRWKGSRMQAAAIEQHENIKAVTCFQLAEQLEMLNSVISHSKDFEEMKSELMSKPTSKDKDSKVQKGLHGIHLGEIKMLEFLKEVLSPITESDVESETADDDKPIHFFLANLAAYTSKLAEHVLTPPLAITPLEAGSESVVPWIPDQIAINLYIINTRPGMDATYLPLGGFDVVWFKDQLLSLELGDMTFTSQKLDLTDDPALATAYTFSVKEYTRPDSAGEVIKGKYIDSTLLRSQLTLPDTASEEEHKVRVKHVPVFLFSVDEPYPMYIDEYYEARALEDMVLIVQSPQRVSSTPLESNGRAVYRSAHNPMGPALQAMANFLGGVLPSHIKFTPGTRSLSQDWFWSVGETPLNPLSLHPRFSLMDKDKIHRSQVIQALDASIEITRQAMNILRRSRTSADNFNMFRSVNTTVLQLKSDFDEIYSLRNQILAMVDHLRYDKARSLLNLLLEKSKRVFHNSEEIFMLIHPSYCDKTEDQGGSPQHNSFLIFSFIFFCSSFLGYIFLSPGQKKPSRFKPKIN